MPIRTWLNHQVALQVSPAGGSTRVPAHWRSALPQLNSPTPVRVELLGFATPAEAERAIPGASAEAAGAFVIPQGVWVKSDTFLPFLHIALSWNIPAGEAYLLAERLQQIRDATRRISSRTLFAGRPLLCVDLIARASESSIYLKGWWRNCHGITAKLIAISPEGERHDVLGALCRFPRADIKPMYVGDEYTGFTVFFQLQRTSVLRTGWVLEIETTDGFVAEAPAPTVLDDYALALAAVLPDLQLERPPRLRGAAGHVHGFISRLQAKRLETFALKEELQFGPSVAQPIVSVIIPVYGRVDLIEHQLAQFALDPVWASCDLIYLLDSPEHWQRVAWRTEWLARLHNLSLRVVHCNQSGGYAAINNLGAKLARADLLLLLNSDVLPTAPGWIEQMITSYRRRPGIGALGTKLVFEDNSIQHAGVGYTATSDGFGWDTLPYYKGLHRDFSDATQARPVTAVTGACLMVDKNLFQRVAGFDQGYVQGDFEDVDLCLRLLRAGFQNWYDPEIELYHLEGVSYPLPERRLHATYNRWLHSHRWSGVIERLVNSSDTPFASDTWISA